MSRHMKAAAAGALALAMVVLQGCDIDPIALITFTIEYLTIVDVETCVYQSMIDDLNSTATYTFYEGCLTEKNGKVQNVTSCCADKAVAHSVTVSTGTCCTKEWADTELSNFTTKYNVTPEDRPVYDSITANLTAEGYDEALVGLCNNMTGSMKESMRNESVIDCAPGTDTIDAADMDMHLALLNSKGVRSVHDKTVSADAKRAAGRSKMMAEFRRIKNFGNTLVQPALVSACFFVGGAVVAVVAHGLVKHFRAQSETSSNYARLLA